jgi:hypothetical protein
MHKLFKVTNKVWVHNLGIRPLAEAFWKKKHRNEEELPLYLSPAEKVTERRIFYKHEPVDMC